MTPACTKVLRFTAEGPFALFTCPAFKTERVTYDVMTPSAAQGLVEAILWKPAVEVDIERIEICNPIRRGTMKINGVGLKTSMPTSRQILGLDDTRDLARDVLPTRIQYCETMLLDVRYVVSFRYVMVERDGVIQDPVKYEQMFRKRLERGAAYRLPHFGLQQHVANCRPVRDDDVPIDETKDLGMLPHYRIYGEDTVDTKWFHARLMHGILDVPSRFYDVPHAPDAPDAASDPEDLETMERRQQIEREELERLQAQERAEMIRSRVAARLQGGR